MSLFSHEACPQVPRRPTPNRSSLFKRFALLFDSTTSSEEVLSSPSVSGSSSLSDENRLVLSHLAERSAGSDAARNVVRKAALDNLGQLYQEQGVLDVFENGRMLPAFGFQGAEQVMHTVGLGYGDAEDAIRAAVPSEYRIQLVGIHLFSTLVRC